jgi:MATE family multidrug resistance protein
MSEASVSAKTTRAAEHRRARTVASLSLPLIAFFCLQSAVSIASLAMVGRLGTASLAGIGIANAVLTAAMSLLNGFDTAVQALAARAIGAGARDLAGRILSEAHCLSLPLGIALTAFLLVGNQALVGVLTSDVAVRAAAAAVLSGAAPCLAFLAVTIPINAYWIGSGVPKIIFLVGAVVAPLQIAATWPLVFGFGAIPGFGLFGAGLAVSLGTLLGLLIQLWLALGLRPIDGFHRYRPRAGEFGAVVSVGWPVSLQQCFLQSGLIIAFAIVSQIGVTAIALLNVLTALSLVPTQIATGLAVASAPLIGQALGRNDPEAAKDWGWRMSLAGAALVLPFGLLALVVPRALLAPFLTDPHTLAQAVFPLQLGSIGISIQAFAMILAFALRGAGATKVATGIPFLLQYVLRLPLMWLVGVKLHQGFNGIVVLSLVAGTVEALVLAFVWQRERWAKLDPLALRTRTDVHGLPGNARRTA